MVKTLKEKMLERRIARLEKLVTSNKRRKFEDVTEDYDDGMFTKAKTLGDVLTETVGLSRGTDPKTVLRVIRKQLPNMIVDLAKATGVKNTRDTEGYLTEIWDNKVSFIGCRGKRPTDIDFVTVVIEGERHGEYIIFDVYSDDYIGRGDTMNDLELN